MITVDDPTRPSRAPDARVIADVMAAFGLGPTIEVEPVRTGTMNLNWRVVTPAGAFAVKQIVDASTAESRRQHQALRALAARGMPTPVPVPLASRVMEPGRDNGSLARYEHSLAGHGLAGHGLAGHGPAEHGPPEHGPPDTVLDHPAGSFSVIPWVGGRHRGGAELDLAEAFALGRFLAGLHVDLAAVLPAAPETIRAETADPDATLDAIEGYLALIDSRPDLDEFDAAARPLLLARRSLIHAQLHLRPVDRGPVGPAGWTHGDFQQFNLLWDGGRIVAVLDWDRLRVDEFLAELVRAAVLVFALDDAPGLDLAKVSAFVSGYSSICPSVPDAIVGAVHRWWWNHMCGLWELDRHYHRHQTRCDHFFVHNSALVAWWSNHHEDVRTAFTSL